MPSTGITEAPPLVSTVIAPHHMTLHLCPIHLSCSPSTTSLHHTSFQMPLLQFMMLQPFFSPSLPLSLSLSLTLFLPLSPPSHSLSSLPKNLSLSLALLYCPSHPQLQICYVASFAVYIYPSTSIYLSISLSISCNPIRL